MGICYDLVSDSTMESFELGKSFWNISWYFFQDYRISCKFCKGSGVIPPTPGFSLPCVDCNATGMVRKEGFRPTSYEELITYFRSKLDEDDSTEKEDNLKYIVTMTSRIWDFMEKHPDWKLLNDASDDYSTFDTKEKLEADKIKWPSKHRWGWPRYIQVGTRYDNDEN
jgi:hypothetical protein